MPVDLCTPRVVLQFKHVGIQFKHAVTVYGLYTNENCWQRSGNPASVTGRFRGHVIEDVTVVCIGAGVDGIEDVLGDEENALPVKREFIAGRN